VKLKSILAAAAVVLLCSCSGQDVDEGGSAKAGNGNKIKLSIQTNNETFKTFEAKSSFASLEGNMQGGGAYVQTLNIIIGNYDVVISGNGLPSEPPAGKSLISIQLSGKPSKDKKALIPIAPGIVSNFGLTPDKPFIGVSRLWSDHSSISGGSSIFIKDLKGSLELTEISDSRAKGTLDYTEGDTKLHVEFDVAIEESKGF